MDIPDVLSRFVPTFDTLFLNVKETDAANFTRTGHPFGWLLTVLQKENADKTSISGALLEAISRLNALGAEQTAQRRRAIVYLILLILHRRPGKEQEELLALVNEHTDTMEVETMAQSIIELSERRGERRGEKRGEKRGETRAKQAAVLKLLQIRFDSVPESFISEITSIRSLSRLDLLFERVATAQTLDEIEL
jgi:predicted transposase YdaD